jgi:hypothetical protein
MISFDIYTPGVASCALLAAIMEPSDNVTINETLEGIMVS